MLNIDDKSILHPFTNHYSKPLALHLKAMISYIKSRLKEFQIRIKHPELQSGKLLDFASVQALNKILTKNNTIANPLTPLGGDEIGYKGDNPTLVHLFDGITLGTWAIDSRTIDWIWNFLSQNKPSTILEFGSGSSTCLFCAWMKERNPSGNVISIDQSEAEAKKTSARLREHGLSDYGTVIAMNVNSKGEFIVDNQKINYFLSGKKVDLLFVDGPAGPAGCRTSTLKDSLQHLSQSGHWFIHDAYRTAELDIINQWTQLEGFNVDGILACGKGLGIGHWKHHTC